MNPENDFGNCEYKRHLLNSDEEKLAKRTTQLVYRLKQGQGKAIYFIGIDDDGSFYGLTREQIEESISNLKLMANDIGAILQHNEIVKIDKDGKSNLKTSDTVLESKNKKCC